MNSGELRTLLAEFLEIDPATIDNSFSLVTPKLQGSVRRFAFEALVRKRLGATIPELHTACTFGELLHQGALTLAAEPATNRDVTRTELMNQFGVERCGVDLEQSTNLPETSDYFAEPFYAEAFHPAEIAYCSLQVDPRENFAGRWAVKEAARKCLPPLMAVPLNQLEVRRADSGSLSLWQHSGGGSRPLAVAVSLSHSSGQVIGLAVAAPTELHTQALTSCIRTAESPDYTGLFAAVVLCLGVIAGALLAIWLR